MTEEEARVLAAYEAMSDIVLSFVPPHLKTEAINAALAIGNDVLRGPRRNGKRPQPRVSK